MADEKKVFDVAKPGTTKPDMGSKPMIVGHKSSVTDPMVKKDGVPKDPTDTPAIDDKPDDAEKIAGSSTNVKIEPVSEDMKAKIMRTDEKTTKTEDQKEGKVAEEKSEVKKTDTKPEDKQDDEKDTKPAAKKEVKPVETSQEKTKDKEVDSKDEKPSKEDAKKEEKIDPAALAMEQEDNLNKIVNSRKYNVDVKEAKSNAMKTFLYVFFGLVVTGFVSLFVLIDTNVIDPGVELPFRIFGTEEVQETDQQVIKEAVEEEQKEDTQDTIDPANSWFKFSTDNYSIRLADGWELLRTGPLIFSESLTLNEGTAATVTEETDGRDGVCCFWVQYVEPTALYDLSMFEEKEDAIIKSNSDKDIYKYRSEITEDPEGIGPLKGSVEYAYVITGEIGDSLVMRYTVLSGAIDNTELIEKVIVTAELL